MGILEALWMLPTTVELDSVISKSVEVKKRKGRKIIVNWNKDKGENTEETENIKQNDK